jgi:multiple antibiotic resistance protein
MSALAAAVAPLAAQGSSVDYVVGAGEIFTLFFIVLGPLKLLGPFAQQTRALDGSAVRALAWRATLIAAASVVGGGFIGSALLRKWQIDPALLALTLGLIFFVVALRLVLQQYDAPPAAQGAVSPPAPGPLRIVFPLIAPPYGVAAVIAMLALSQDRERTALVCGLALANLALDYFAMLFARSLMRGFGLALMQVLGALLGVLQVALALRIIFMALETLGVLHAAGLRR